ncbi:MAG: phosphoribosylformylglycinamidine synthase subunit PurS [Cyanobacteriota bacterium]
MKLLYEGKTKIISISNNNNELIAEYKDTLTAYNNKKKDLIVGKGLLCSSISAIIFDYLNKNSIKTHYIYQEGNKHSILNLKMIPLEVVIRNISAGSLVKRFDIKRGVKLGIPIIEFYYKKDELDDPLVNQNHIKYFNILHKYKDLKEIEEIAYCVNSLLIMFFNNCNFELVDFKLEFGYDNKYNLILADEMSPDNIRLWDKTTGLSYDKDLFRNDSGDVIKAYKDVFDRMKNINITAMKEKKYVVEILIEPRADIFDPQGATINKSLFDLGFEKISNLRVGKYIKFSTTAETKIIAEDLANKACEKLLANPVTEDHSIKVTYNEF